jgi:hypothetical protein
VATGGAPNVMHDSLAEIPRWVGVLETKLRRLHPATIPLTSVGVEDVLQEEQARNGPACRVSCKNNVGVRPVSADIATYPVRYGAVQRFGAIQESGMCIHASQALCRHY